MGQPVTSIRPSAVFASTGDVNTPASNTNAVVTYAAVPGVGHLISGIAWSYSGGTPTGSLIITDGGNTVFSIDIASAGAGFVTFNPSLKTTAGNAMVITLGAGGSGVTGKLSILSHWTE